jgi:hypothetical protein
VGKIFPPTRREFPSTLQALSARPAKCQLVIGWQDFILAHDWWGMLQKQRGKLV